MISPADKDDLDYIAEQINQRYFTPDLISGHRIPALFCSLKELIAALSRSPHLSGNWQLTTEAYLHGDLLASFELTEANSMNSCYFICDTQSQNWRQGEA